MEKNKNVLGTLYFDDPFDKFNPYVFTKNGFVDSHDIMFYVTEKDGVPLAGCMIVTEPGGLADGLEALEASDKPAIHFKFNYNNVPVNNVFYLTSYAVSFFERYTDKEKKQYYVVEGALPYEIAEEVYDDMEYSSWWKNI